VLASITKSINCRGELICFDEPKLMGILNLTSDSFYDGGQHNNLKKQLQQVETMLIEGADIIDIGATSTRPGAKLSKPMEELNTLLPVIEAIQKEFPNCIVSIDTYHAKVADDCIKNGVHIINDVSGGLIDEAMIPTVAKYKNIPYVMMHLKGIPENMQQQCNYENLMAEIIDYFLQRINLAKKAGIKDLIIDAGFGFGKNTNQNFELLQRLNELRLLGNFPVLSGLSRKSLIWKTLNIKPAEALNGTTVLNTIALLNGSNILRVHDVAAAKQAITLLKHLKAA